ncbi:MAG TPA: hypothetical protein VK716_17975 [Terracidiphilus sp.]|jgi:hypothetical protein|nr:hypothetical protein [Terracidiphilus sp.]
MKTVGGAGVSGLARFSGALILVGALAIGLAMWGVPVYDRYQTRANEANKIQVNELQIRQTEQLVQVEKQKAQIRIVDAEGIAESQRIINATLTDRYLQHEAIQAQLQMANSPNHTTIYIPSGNNGIPLVKTVDDTSAPTEKSK